MVENQCINSGNGWTPKSTRRSNSKKAHGSDLFSLFVICLPLKYPASSIVHPPKGEVLCPQIQFPLQPVHRACPVPAPCPLLTASPEKTECRLTRLQMWRGGEVPMSIGVWPAYRHIYFPGRVYIIFMPL